MVGPPEIFSPIFSINIAFFEKIVKWKNIQNLISDKKGYLQFRRRTLPSLQKRLALQKRFLQFSEKITAFFEKTVK